MARSNVIGRKCQNWQQLVVKSILGCFNSLCVYFVLLFASYELDALHVLMVFKSRFL
jgi:hypothetical protein